MPDTTTDLSMNLWSVEAAEAEKQLWRAVIASTIREWITGPLSRKREAERYLFADEVDFRVVCEAAGIDVGQLRTRLLRMRSQGQLERCAA